MLRYERFDVGDQPSFSMHVRDATTKGLVKMNHKTMAFFLHGQSIYYWIQDGVDFASQKLQRVSLPNSNSYFQTAQTKFLVIDDNNFVVSQLTNETNKNFKLFQFKMDFNTFEVEMLVQEKQVIERVKSFAYDPKNNIVLLLINTVDRKDDYRIRIVDITNKQVLWNSGVKNRELIGRIKSGLFTLIDGHFYFSNNIIKIRLDLLRNMNMNDLPENQAFDFFDIILSLDANEKIKQYMPICSLMHHRFMYMTTNPSNLKPNKLKICPFLHERKVYLEKNNASCDFFNTAIETSDGPMFISMNVSLSEYKIFSQGGLLRHHIMYRRIVEMFGNPVTVSNNGQVFIFKQPKQLLLTLMVLTNKGFLKVKTLSELESMARKAGFTKENANVKVVVNDKMDVVVRLVLKK